MNQNDPMTPTTLSPAAQAVLDAFLGDAEDTGLQIDDLRENVAAALRAAADQVVPQCRKPMYADSWEESAWTAQQDIRAELLAIADELEGAN